MKFGLSQLLESTPKMMAKFGHALVVATAVITFSNFSQFPKLQIGLQLAGFFGYFLVNMFGQ